MIDKQQQHKVPSICGSLRFLAILSYASGPVGGFFAAGQAHAGDKMGFVILAAACVSGFVGGTLFSSRAAVIEGLFNIEQAIRER